MSTGYVALTFDDGPTADTPALLAALRKAGARATMFNIGQLVRRHPELTRAQRAAGMWIGNHSWTHPHLTGLAPERIGAELADTQREIERVSGERPRLFRPPYGDTDAEVRSAQAGLGLTEVLWTVDTRDWAGADTRQVIEAAASASDGDVVLLHDGYPATVAAVPTVVRMLAERGLAPGRICADTGCVIAP